jgi:hypothetical protein
MWDHFPSDQADLQWESAKQRRLAEAEARAKVEQIDVTEQDLEKHREGDSRDLMTKTM